MTACRRGCRWQYGVLLGAAWLLLTACAGPDAAVPAEAPQPVDQSLTAVMDDLGETLLVILPTLHADQVDPAALQQQMLRLGLAALRARLLAADAQAASDPASAAAAPADDQVAQWKKWNDWNNWAKWGKE